MTSPEWMSRRAKVSGLVLGASMVLALVVLWPVVTHHAAKRRLERYKQQIAANGEKLRIDELAPALSPASLSAGGRLMAATVRLGTAPYSNFPPVMKLLSPGRALVSWKQEIQPND